MELSVPCPNENCDEIIRKGEMESHTKVCPYTLLSCPNNLNDFLNQDTCGMILRKDLERHKNDECPFRVVHCLLNCGLKLPLNSMEEHI